jgi:DNA (cytosine-5)-methyltransferase 1
MGSLAKETHASARPLRAIDLFAGAGGMTCGLEDAGFTVIGAVEVDSLAAETYGMNHPNVRVWQDDIRNLDPIGLRAELGLEEGELDLVAGCPPCQGFSTITTLNGRNVVDDERNDLVLEYARYVRAFRPRAVLMENVPGLAKDARMATLVQELEDMGYPVREGVRVLNAADFGVPQRRRRLVMLAAHGSVVPFAPALATRSTVRDAIGGLSAAGGSGDPLHDVPENRSDAVRARIAKIPKNGGSRHDLGPENQLPCHRRTNGFKDIYGRMAWDKPAPTITGGCHNPSKGRFLHPEANRTITLREAALLQGFSRDYRFSLRRGKLAAAAMIGNALPPAFVAAHARQLARSLA